MKYFCNPVNADYRYQYINNPETGSVFVLREAADPSLIYFKGKYYLFASMTLGVWVSDDLVSWDNHRLPDMLPLYDYAPDVRVIDHLVYFCASNRGEVCHFYRTSDILNGPYEKIEGSFEFFDPNLFQDVDGRLYFYWGCTNSEPIWGIELDPVTLKPLGDKVPLIHGNPAEKGFERKGEDHHELNPRFKAFMDSAPYIEGAWMDFYQGQYYLQYACPGTEYNIYADGVYQARSPLGPFTLASNNPYSYKPGGFITGAGHGSTMKDPWGNLWHASTLRISVNHMFERRIGIWPAGFDNDGELFCNQRYGDWPMSVESAKMDPWRDPEWLLLSYRQKVTASSAAPGKGPELAVDENVQTWWMAASTDTRPWLEMDLGQACHVHAIQINFADDTIDRPVPGEIRGTLLPRYIDDSKHVTRWILEGSLDGQVYQTIEDQSAADSNWPHDLVVIEQGMPLQFIRLTVLEIPYHLQPCISGLRVFGRCEGQKPLLPEYELTRMSDLDFDVAIKPDPSGIPVVGYNILWGHAADKLYHSYMILGKHTQRIGALIKGQSCFLRVDAFNRSGITAGKVKKLTQPERVDESF